MVPSRSPRGLIIDLVTPLRANGEIDGPGLGRLLDRVLPHVQAVFIASPTLGQGKNLSTAQREELLEKTLVVVRGRVPILVWISRDSQEKTRQALLKLEKTREKRKYSGPILWVDTPLYYHSNRGLPDYYRNLSSSVQGSYLLHNDPNLVKELARPLKRSNIRTSILKEIAKITSIEGLIFLGSLERARNYQKATRSRVDFRIYDGDESHFLQYPSLSGVVSAGANLAPRAWQRITDSSLNISGAGDAYPDQVRQIVETGEYLRKLMSLYRGAPVSLIKQVLSDLGLIEVPRNNLPGNNSEKRVRALKDLMAAYGDYP